jgi:hypothetical protein
MANPTSQLALGQGDACDILTEFFPEGAPGAAAELARPTLDLNRLRDSILEPRERTDVLPASAVAMRALGPSPVPADSPFERQVPAYLLPRQATAQRGFLIEQQGGPLLPAFLRRLFTFARTEEGT